MASKINKEFLANGYFETREGKQVVRADLMDEHARAYGEIFARGKKESVSSSQLRKFYADVKSLEQKIDRGNFDKFHHLVKMLKSKVSYIQGKKGGGRVSYEFRDYIHTCIDQINSKKEFEAFLKFFESTVGFYYGAGGEKNK